ncbi:MAG: phosphoribosylformylglycinamidine synthase subunit PurL, partial [Calothrix sp. SM1_5_4]|nr:phosphoribosylformylglycinamidine synthase subunit PurL [Calothrix sp. SM1_5_4]
MSEQELSAKLSKYRLSKDEYGRIQKLLGRDPQGVEWALFSALWSEHCSYKSSKVHLRKFAFKSARVLQSMGENAGVIDLGHGEKVAFKMESHNHPSFIEPYQGAATGVGGILRDIFTMGARPIALANYLCFGEPTAPRMSHLVEGVVSGISGYGNCVGVPTVTGQTEFHSSYNNNILVNALAVGLFTEDDPVVTASAHGVGNLVVYVGAKTGRDGVHGASMASEAFGADSASKRPTVQIGDPFFEKLLIESCLEVMKKDLVAAIQDMGAAGLTSSSFEMAAKGGVGLKLHLDQVPLRDSSVGPEEILLSESQERMLLVCEPAKFEAIRDVFHRWGLDASILGEVTAGPEIELFWRKDLICKIDPKLLTDNAPVYERPYEEWAPKLKGSVDGLALRLEDELTSELGTSRRWIFQQYDQRVGGKTVRDCDDSLAVVRLPSGRGLGLVLGCRPHVMRLDAELGGFDAVFYPALELAAKGFQPLAVTDCLNFGNPEKLPVMSEFVAAVEALAEGSKLLDAPVISGNVSFYNETLNQNITSTPATGLVGLRDDVSAIPASRFRGEGDEIWLWRYDGVRFSSDQLGRSAGFTGELDGESFARWLNEVLEAGRGPRVSATRVCGKFGVQYALYRMCTESLGAEAKSGEWGGFSDERLYEVILA